MRRELLLIGLLFILSGSTLNAQGYVDQDAAAPVLESQIGTAEGVIPAKWHRFSFKSYRKGGSKAAMAALKAHLDSLPGPRSDHRMEIIELSNRVREKYMLQRSYLLVPDSFVADFRAYSPFPLHYEGADSLSKLMVIDKYTQTFGAYEYGSLVRWGLVSTGREDDLTPAGTYHFNWKTEYRESTEAPPGEVWKLHWVFNFDAKKGIHVHQYQLPIGMAASHGCVRMTEADAHWNYNWASQWIANNGVVKRCGTPVLVVNQISYMQAAHWHMDPDDTVYSLVNLPPSPGFEPSGAVTPEATVYNSAR